MQSRRRSQKQKKNLVQAKVEENTQYQSMKIRIKYMYENGNMEFIEVLADSENISDFLIKQSIFPSCLNMIEIS